MSSIADKNQIISIEKELLIAMKNCDVLKLNELIHDNLLFSIPNGQCVTKAMDLEVYSSGKMKIDEISSSEQEINLIGDNAVVSVIIEIKGMYFDQVFDGKYRINRVWKLVNNKLTVIAGSSIQL